MKKRELKLAFLFVICAVLATSFVSAQANETDIEDSYQCLEDQIDSNPSLSLQEAVFSTLALGSSSDLIDKIEDEEHSSDACWPKSGCEIKDTAQVLLAYDRIGRSTSDIESWLLGESETVAELNWFLQIDIENSVAASCTIGYDDDEENINILDDQTVTGDPGSCLDIANFDYWLSIRDNCLDEEYMISCDQDFVTTLLYQKDGGAVFVSSEVSSSASLGTTAEQIKAKCFKTGGGCDYEGSLWAAVALQKAGEDISDYVPYLLALADRNQRFFPSAFLYSLVGGDSQFSDIVQNQKIGGFWQITASPYNRFYDTSLAMLALSTSSADELDTAKDYLSDVQTADGCWNNNNIRDTAFVLYSGWTRQASLSPTVTSTPDICEDAGKFCEQRVECTDSGGTVLFEFDCPTGGYGVSCCSVEVIEETCSEKGGEFCASGEQCDGTSVSASDGTCCIGSCEEVEEETECELFGGACRSDCLSTEDADVDLSCDSGDICCFEAEEEEGGISLIIIILLGILIVLVILAILSRNRIRVWVYKFRGARRAPVVRPGAPAPPRAAPPRAAPVRAAPVRRRAPTAAEKEMQETLRKLREAGK